jgi:hypothetical protein
MSQQQVIQKVTKHYLNRKYLERYTKESDSLVYEKTMTFSNFLSTTGHVRSCGNQPIPLGKAKYLLRPIVN